MNKDKNYWGHFFSSFAYATVASIFVYIIYQREGVYAYYQLTTFDFVMLSLAVFRLTRLFVNDLIMDFVRDFFRKSENYLGFTISEILGCPWCTGVWLALFVSFFYFLTPIAWYFIFFLALAGAGSFIQLVSNLIIRLPGKK